MVVRYRLTGPLLGVGCVLLVLACRRPSPVQADAGPAPSAVPVDHLAPNEVPEGKERAFGLPLPRATRVAARFPDAVHVSTTHTPEELANFVRSRVREGKTMTGTSVTRFDDVIPIADPAKRLQIEIRKAPISSDLRSDMVIRNMTPLTSDVAGSPSQTPEEAMRKAGRTPDGKLVDPKHMQ